MLRDGTQKTLIESKQNLPTAMSHAEIVKELSPKIKAQSFFSARVAEAHILDRLRDVSDRYSRGEIGLGEARNELKAFLAAEGYDPHKGGLKNLASTARLNLILKQNAAMANAAAEWKRMHSPEAMKLFPYVRYHARGDARTRSEHADLDGMIFRKDDPFLLAHTPPWEFNCRCYLEEVTEEEANQTPELIQEPTPADEVTVDSRSGFHFDPSKTFEEFDVSAVKDPETRANVMDYMTDRFSEQTKELYRDHAVDYLEGKAAELQRRVAAEAQNKIFPAEPKTRLTGKNRERARAEARRAVPPATMDRTDEAVKKLREQDKKAIKPFLHYSGRPGDSENNDIRAAAEDGEINWEKVSPKALKKINALQGLLDQMPKFHGTLYRGCAFENKDDFAGYVASIFEKPKSLTGFISTTPDPVVAHHYAANGKYKVVIVIPNSRNAVYFGPYSKHPEDEEALMSYKFYLQAVDKFEKDGILYIMAEEVPR